MSLTKILSNLIFYLMKYH